MAPRVKKDTGPKGLCAFLVEIVDCDGKTSVPSDFTFLVRKSMEDKIFSENADRVAVCRSDTTSHITFVAYDWDGLRKALDVLNETKNSDEGGVENPVSCINDIVRAMDAQNDDVDYNDKKIIYFASLASYMLDEEEVTQLADNLLAKDIYLSIVLPNKEDMSEIQMQNSRLLKEVFNQDKYDNISVVTNLRKAQKQILNVHSKRSSRPTAWNVPFEISSKITINVSGYVGTRKNKIGEMEKVFIKQGWLPTERNQQPSANSTQLGVSNQSGASNGSVSQAPTPDANGAQATTVKVESAKKVLEKEEIWSGKDNAPVDKDSIVKAYYFGDKLISFNEMDKEESYSSGEKCLKLLAFCPFENINPAYLTGDGTTLIYARKDDQQAETMIKALIQTMIKQQKVAIVRRVYSKNTRPVLGVLCPDEEQWCLIFVELSYADDISVPQFPPLIKSDEITEEVMVESDTAVLSDREQVLDKLISAKTLNNFDPIDGPGDPAVSALRETVSRKILKDSLKDSADTIPDNIDVFFQRIGLEDTLVSEILEEFPLKESKPKEERPSGATVFGSKRSHDESMEIEAEKKPKLEVEEEKPGDKAEADNQDEINELLDEF